MIDRDPEELELLAGEYVLGVLDREKAREIESALTQNAGLRRAVQFWEERLHGLSRLAPEETPPAELWDGIAGRIAGFRTQVRPRLWDSVTVWRSATVFATAAAASLAVYLAVSSQAEGPRFLAVLRDPRQNQPAFVATVQRDSLVLRATGGETAPRGRSFELWAIAPGAKQPQPLGIIPVSGRFVSAAPNAISAGGMLAISVEPPGGSPTGQPTGPVVFAGELLAAGPDSGAPQGR